MSEEFSDIIQANKKLRKLEEIASGTDVSLDSNSLKTKLATFIVAHADKVMDTVAPLETLREMLTEQYITKAQERFDDPEVTTGMIASMIADIQEMNLYSLKTLASVLDADKLQTFIAIDASDRSQTQVNVLNLETAPSRAKVAKAVSALNKLLEQKSEVIEEEGQSDGS